MNLHKKLSLMLSPQYVQVILILFFVLVNLSAYIDKMPLFHEEPRRAIIAQEMWLTGDYVVPKVYQKPYLKKPPFQNWMIIIFSMPWGKVNSFSARLVSISSLILTGILVYVLLFPIDRRIAYLAFLICLTNYQMLCEFGNKAEPDILLTLLTFLSFFFYIKNPARLRNIAISSAFLGVGILTKGLSPIFFYPGIVLHTYLSGADRRKRSKYLFLHFGLTLLVPIAWLVLYYLQGNIKDLLGTFSSEMLLHTGGNSGGFLTHAFYYPVKIFMVLLPWSLVVLLAYKSNLQGTEIYRFSLLIFVFSFIFFTLSPRGLDRYLMPAFPFFAIVAAHHIQTDFGIHHRVQKYIWLLFSLLFLATSIIFLYRGNYLHFGIFFMLMPVSLFLAQKPVKIIPYVTTLVLLFFIWYEHGLYFYRTQIKFNYENAARDVALKMKRRIPIVVEDQLNPIQLVVYLEGFVHRVVYTRSVGNFPSYYYLTRRDDADSRGMEVLRMTYPKKRIKTLLIQRVESFERRR